MKFHVIQHKKRASRGIAEIYIDGGAFSYIQRTCICRIYQKHLDNKTAGQIVSKIAAALNATIEKEIER